MKKSKTPDYRVILELLRKAAIASKNNQWSICNKFCKEAAKISQEWTKKPQNKKKGG